MNLDNLAIEIRPRNSWKSFDLGCRMALRWWKSLLGFWLVATLPVFVLACSIDIVWGVVFFWWLKPLYERGLLHILSRQVFGETVTAKDALKAWPQLLKTQWFASISWRRFSPTRGFDLAILQLEGLAGTARSKRLSILHRTTDDNTAWWTFICLGWELILIFGMVALVSFVIPAGVEFDYWVAITSDSWAVELTYNVFTYVAYLLIAPIYIAGSFAAYLNRRVMLEAWDIEIGFKRAVKHTLKPNSGVMLSAMLGLLFFVTPIPETWADEAPQISDAGTVEKAQNVVTDETETLLDTQVLVDTQTSIDTQTSLDSHPMNEPNIEFASEGQIQAIMDAPPFNGRKTETRYRWVGWDSKDDEDEQNNQSSSDFPAWLTSALLLFANLSEVLMWLGFGFLLLLLLYLSKDNIKAFFNKAPIAEQSNESTIPLFSQSYAGDTIPDDVSSEIDRLFDAQAYRKLMSLMLITSLLEISKEQALPLTKSMTERECLEVIKTSVIGERKEFMQLLIDTWVHLAWAHSWPPKSTMQALCSQWKSLFDDIELDAVT